MTRQALLLAALTSLIACGGGSPSHTDGPTDVVEDTVQPDTDVEAEPDPFGIVAIDPARLDFTGIPPNTAVTSVVTISNTGTERFRIFEISVDGDTSFSVDIGSQVFPSSWEPGESIDVTVTFNPLDTEPAEARLVVDSDAPEGIEEIPMTGNAAPPCIDVSPTGPLFMGGHEAGATSIREVLVHNCSASETLEVSGITFEGDAGFELGVLPDGSTGDSFSVRPGFDANLTVRYNGEAGGTVMQIPSNDASMAVVQIPISSAGTSACPTAIGRCREVGTEEWTNALITSVDTELECDASESITDGAVEEAYWELLGAPAGGQRLFENLEADRPTFTVDTPGAYNLALHVLDEAGQTSCVPSDVTIAAESVDDLVVLLEWTSENPFAPVTEDDANLDLHLRRGEVEWGDGLDDFSAESGPLDWGGETRDAILVETTRRERITINSPNESYRIGVQNMQAAASGPTYATVRVYSEGELVHEVRGRDLSDEGAFWEVANVSDGAIVILDRVTAEVP